MKKYTHNTKERIAFAKILKKERDKGMTFKSIGKKYGYTPGRIMQLVVWIEMLKETGFVR